jgi:tRNA (guanine37-N1)-methyltransferase
MAQLRIDILTLFPGMFSGPFAESIVKRAIDGGLIAVNFHKLRDWGVGRHKVVDDYPFGGGAGMVMKPEPLFEAVAAIRAESSASAPVILLTPQGRVFSQRVAVELAARDQFILVCGHYEGIDERVREHLATDEISIGDYVLTGGEIAAMVVVDAVARLVPGVLGSDEAAINDSHSGGLLEHPQYTRPQSYRRWRVPEVLLSGNHAQIARWRREQSILRTLERRPELLEGVALSREERAMVSRRLQEKGEQAAVNPDDIVAGAEAVPRR